jgi:hypothetical protein
MPHELYTHAIWFLQFLLFRLLIRLVCEANGRMFEWHVGRAARDHECKAEEGGSGGKNGFLLPPLLPQCGTCQRCMLSSVSAFIVRVNPVVPHFNPHWRRSYADEQTNERRRTAERRRKTHETIHESFGIF